MRVLFVTHAPCLLSSPIASEMLKRVDLRGLDTVMLQYYEENYCQQLSERIFKISCTMLKC